MTEQEVKQLNPGDFIEIKIDNDIYIGSIVEDHYNMNNSILVYLDFCLTKKEWDLDTIRVNEKDYKNIKKYLPQLESLDSQIKRIYPQYFI